MITRDLFPEIPPHVEYELRSLGKSLLRPMQGLVDWVATNLGAGKQSAVSVRCEVDVSEPRFPYRIYAPEGVAGTKLPFNAVHAARESM